MSRTRLALTAASVVALQLAACDPYYRVVVTAPLTHPLPDSCAQQVFQALTSMPPFRVASSPSTRMADTASLLLYLGALSPLSQVRHKDSTALLEASMGRLFERFDGVEVDRIGRELGPVLIRVRDECGGTGRADVPYRVRRSPF